MSGITVKKINEEHVTFTFNNGSLTVHVRRGDLSVEKCDAIVNPTNTKMEPNGGLDSIIHERMGTFFTDQVIAVHKDKKDAACPIGQSRIFISKFAPATDEPRYVICTAGPNYTEYPKEQAGFLLRSCYFTSLTLANLYQISSIAYPSISCGMYKYPPNEAARVGIESIREYANNIKDVRFTLFDTETYKVFLSEWTAYAAEVNEAHAPATKSAGGAAEDHIVKKLANSSINHACILCGEKEQCAQNNELCKTCSALSRSELFIKLLKKLRGAAANSYKMLVDTCSLYRPLVLKYPLIFCPAQTFKQDIHKRDAVAESYVQSYCDKELHCMMPMAITGDGNCLYNTFVQLNSLGSDCEVVFTPVELRVRNIIELVLNQATYEQRYSHMKSILDGFEKYVCEEMVRDTYYASIWDLFSIATVLNVHLMTVYPRVNGPHDITCNILNKTNYFPLENKSSNFIADSGNGLATVTILFSNCMRPLVTDQKNQKSWMPNHFVPLLKLPGS